VSFTSLKTAAFRNLVDGETDIGGKDVFLVGENGQGKSNFLEALYFCSYASSFRSVQDKDLVRTGEKDCSAALALDNSLYSSVSVSIREGKKNIFLAGKRIEDRKELLSVAPAIVFCHEDMEFVAGNPERRRWFFDQTRSLWDPLYLDSLRKYRHVLKSRNTLLRGNRSAVDGSSDPARPFLHGETGATLDALDPQFAFYGLELMSRRRESAQEFSLVFENLYREISGIAGIGVEYLPSWKGIDSDSVTGRLREKREAEISAGISLSGPHRDRYIFMQNGAEFAGKASTGQRRLLALLLRISQAVFFFEKTMQKPVLLLDDVLLELDGEKRIKFLSVMPEYEQAFLTFLPEEPFDKYLKKDTLILYMKAGKAKRA
jgi:DNA replication and repair protein RecF